MDFTTLFVDVDDCWRDFEKNYAAHLITDGVRKRNRQSKLSISEIMPILIAFQTSSYRTFKAFDCRTDRLYKIVKEALIENERNSK